MDVYVYISTHALYGSCVGAVGNAADGSSSMVMYIVGGLAGMAIIAAGTYVYLFKYQNQTTHKIKKRGGDGRLSEGYAATTGNSDDDMGKHE